MVRSSSFVSSSFTSTFYYFYIFFLDQNRKLWTGLEKYIGERIHTDIKLILENCGYDNYFSLVKITEKELLEIVQTVNIDTNCLKKLKTYDKNIEFKLKPGHRQLIFNLSGKVEDYLELKKNTKRTSKEKTENELKK